MVDAERDAIRQREKGRATVRSLYLGELEDARAKRTAALQEADAQLDRVARLLPDALDAGLTIAEIARVADVSRPTLYQLRGRYSEDERDLRLAVLQAVANYGWARRANVATEIGRESDHVDAVINELIDGGLLREDFNDDHVDPAVEIALTDEGFERLDHYWMSDDIDAEEQSP